MKKIISIALSVMMLVTMTAVITPSASAVFKGDLNVAAGENNGTCGDGITWVYDDTTKELKIEGSGAMEDYTSTERAPWYALRNSIESVVTDGGLTSIGDYAFYGCKEIKTVALADTVESLGEYSFYNCDALEAVTVPASVETIETYAFSSCDALADIKLEEGVATIGDYAFSSLTALKTMAIPASVTSMGAYAFAANTALETVTLEDGLKTISERAFTDCTSLANVTIPESVETIGDYAFKNSEALKKITIPANVATLGEGSFYGSGLETLVIEDGLKEIGKAAFAQSAALKSVDLGKVEIIGDEAFSGCAAIESVTVPATVKEIRLNAFSGCTGAKEFKFEDASKITVLEFSDIWADNKAWVDRITGLCGDEFKLFDSSYNNYTGDKLDLSGYDSNKGDKNGDESSTWLYKSAKWLDDDMKTAELRIDFSYLPLSVPTDIVFVLDYSGSMMESVDGVSKLYTLTSKVDDIAKSILTSETLDNRIAIVPFSEGLTDTLDFTNDYNKIHDFLFSVQPEGDTHYSEGFKGASDLISKRTDSNRDKMVIFVTDGAPNAGFEGKAQATALKNDGVTIAGIVLDTTEEAYSMVSSLCTKDKVYKSDSNEELNEALNNILISTFISYKITDKIDTENFSIKDASLITVTDSEGKHYDDTVKLASDGATLTWDLSKLSPATNYTLTIILEVKKNVFGSELTTNDGFVMANSSADNATVNQASSPVLGNISNHKLTYHSNNPEDKSVEESYDVTEMVTTKTNMFEYEGYNFKGWNTLADGTGKSIAPGDKFNMPDEDVELYAMWEKKQAPKTGDTTENNMAAVVALFAGLAIMASVAIYMKKRTTAE